MATRKTVRTTVRKTTLKKVERPKTPAIGRRSRRRIVVDRTGETSEPITKVVRQTTAPTPMPVAGKGGFSSRPESEQPPIGPLGTLDPESRRVRRTRKHRPS